MSLPNFDNIYFLPSFHNRLQFALEVRKAFAALKPDVVAVELPDIYYADIIQAVDRLPALTMLCLDHGQAMYEYIPVFPSDSIIEGIRLARDNKLPVSFIDLALKEYKIQDTDFVPPDDYALNYVEISTFYTLNKPYFGKNNKDDHKRESNMAFHLYTLSNKFARILFIGGMSHWEGIRNHLQEQSYQFFSHELDAIKTPFLAKPGEKALFYLLGEIPYLVFQYELARRFNLPYDKWQIILKLLQEAKNTPLLEKENYTTREMNNLIAYTQKLAAVDDQLLPDLYNLLLAGKQTLGDDYGIELLELAMKYPYKENEELPIIDLDKNKFTLGGRRITLQRKLPDYNLNISPTQQWEPLYLIRKKKEELPPDYLSTWFDFGFFSHLPEDLIIENFINRLENKVASEIKPEPIIHEFTGSLFDGLALRETIRNFVYQQKIYVKEYKREEIRIGAWLIIFDDELGYEKYPWAMSLSAEHHNESDLAFYATNPLLHPVSRQIIRAEYGALLAFKPPLPDAEKVLCEELEVVDSMRLYQLMNLAIELSPQKGVLIVSSKVPAPYYYQIAKQKNKIIFHLPLSRLSNRNLKRIRRFHLLKSRKTRKIADDYI